MALAGELPPPLELTALIGGTEAVSARHTPYDVHAADRPLLLREFLQGIVTLAMHVHPRSPQVGRSALNRLPLRPRSPLVPLPSARARRWCPSFFSP
eukprot:5551529-Prymnesium_polylepis.1